MISIIDLYKMTYDLKSFNQVTCCNCKCHGVDELLSHDYSHDFYPIELKKIPMNKKVDKMTLRSACKKSGKCLID